jgi:hypothetical protein
MATILLAVFFFVLEAITTKIPFNVIVKTLSFLKSHGTACIIQLKSIFSANFVRKTAVLAELSDENVDHSVQNS